jgi:hypothetical protein
MRCAGDNFLHMNGKSSGRESRYHKMGASLKGESEGQGLKGRVCLAKITICAPRSQDRPLALAWWAALELDNACTAAAPYQRGAKGPRDTGVL